jgi:hypothetical protein
MCFGDIELQNNRTLIVTALSRSPIDVLTQLLKEIIGEAWEPTEMEYTPITAIDNQTGKQCVLPVETNPTH